MATSATELPARSAMTPVPYRVAARRADTHDTWTIALDALGEPVTPMPGQFVMLMAPGVGEVPISTSGPPDPAGRLVHTIRAVGAVTDALCARPQGSVVGVRGPLGVPWPLHLARDRDLLVVAGGIGLAPLRPAILHALAHRREHGAVAVLIGARGPRELLFTDELRDWGAQVTVDLASPAWHGRVGLVTALIPGAGVDPANTLALVCGPELMMRFTAQALVDRGVPPDRVWISMERNMRCGVGHCGHCQLGPLLLCRDGPVVRYDVAEPLMVVREL